MIVRDITERKQAEAKIRESEEKYRLLFDNTEVLVSVYDREGVCQLMNRRVAALFGGDPQDFIGKSFKELHPEAGENYIRRLQESIDSGISHGYEEEVKFPQGNRWLLSQMQPIPDAQGVLRTIQVVSQDITEHKQAEEALRESEEKFRAIASLSPAAIAILKSDGQGERFLYVNAAWETLTGYTRDDAMLLKPEDIVHPDMRARVTEQAAARMRGEHTSSRYESKIITKSGEIKWLDFAAAVIRYQGAPAILTMAFDITKRKQAEEKLQRYNQRLMILRDIDRDIAIARSPKAIADTVLKHIRQLIPYWMASVALYEPDTDEIIVLTSEANGDTVMPPGTRIPTPTGWVTQMLAEHYNLVKDAHTLPEPISPAVRLAISEGTRSYLSASLVVEGNLIGALILSSKTPAAFTAEHLEIASEVSNQLAIAIRQAQLKEQIERYSAELEKRVAQRTAQLESANKDLESFSYSVSHDLRAPLRAINGFAAIVARRHRADLNEEGQHYVDNIVLASERMGHLIDDLLQYSRLGRSSVRRERVPLREVFDPLASDLATHLAEIGGTLNIAADLPAVMGDRTLLSQVFANLLENAITYRQPDVPVQVTISCQIEDKDIVVCVGDNGIGIPSEYYEKIFNIFQRLHSDDEYPGTGIGLSTVKKSVKLLGGRVWVESVVGKGSKFFVKLPKE
jgi:PAS domain S-box-containing protein